MKNYVQTFPKGLNWNNSYWRKSLIEKNHWQHGVKKHKPPSFPLSTFCPAKTCLWLCYGAERLQQLSWREDSLTESILELYFGSPALLLRAGWGDSQSPKRKGAPLLYKDAWGCLLGLMTLSRKSNNHCSWSLPDHMWGPIFCPIRASEEFSASCWVSTHTNLWTSLRKSDKKKTPELFLALVFLNAKWKNKNGGNCPQFLTVLTTYITRCINLTSFNQGKKVCLKHLPSLKDGFHTEPKHLQACPGTILSWV